MGNIYLRTLSEHIQNSAKHLINMELMAKTVNGFQLLEEVKKVKLVNLQSMIKTV